MAVKSCVMYVFFCNLRIYKFHYGGWKKGTCWDLRKHNGGWANEHQRLSVSNNTFAIWQELRTELGLTANDALAIVLPTTNDETGSREEHHLFPLAIDTEESLSLSLLCHAMYTT